MGAVSHKRAAGSKQDAPTSTRQMFCNGWKITKFGRTLPPLPEPGATPRATPSTSHSGRKLMISITRGAPTVTSAGTNEIQF